jgi:hypothetical protein
MPWIDKALHRWRVSHPYWENIKRLLRTMFLAAVWIGAMPGTALALPLYARQTGQQCASCHAGFPELTPFGRAFKLSGYTFGTRQDIPISAMALASVNRIADNSGGAYPKSGTPAVEGGSLFTGGKVTDNVGGFVQWTYNNLVQNPDGSFAGHSSIDNVDLRVTHQLSVRDVQMLVGLTLNNAPMVQDVFNSSPAWAYPYQSPKVASEGFGPLSTFIEAQPRIAGLSAYSFIDNFLYLEMGAYRTADGIFSILRAGTTPNPLTDRVTLKGYNPYWRLTATKNFDHGQSLTVGAFGLNAQQYPDYTMTQGPADRLRDLGVDAQYQFLGGGDWAATAHAYRIREHTDWRATAAAHDSPATRITSTRMSADVIWRNKLQATLGAWRTRGDADFTGLGTVSGRGDTSGRMFEMAYMPIQNMRIGLQRTHYSTFAGLRANYDGAGRNAGSNDTTYLYVWAAY